MGHDGMQCFGGGDNRARKFIVAHDFDLSSEQRVLHAVYPDHTAAIEHDGGQIIGPNLLCVSGRPPGSFVYIARS